MGTRADMYVGRGSTAEWLGSIAWDGYPKGIPADILDAKDATAFREAVTIFLASRDDATLPEMGWPWPWENSQMTDYAYTFSNRRVWISNYGSPWRTISKWHSQKRGPRIFDREIFLDMSAIQRVDFGKRSGIIILRR